MIISPQTFRKVSPNGTEVKVTILSKRPKRVWDIIKQTIAEKYLNLPEMTSADENPLTSMQRGSQL